LRRIIVLGVVLAVGLTGAGVATAAATNLNILNPGFLLENGAVQVGVEYRCQPRQHGGGRLTVKQDSGVGVAVDIGFCGSEVQTFYVTVWPRDGHFSLGPAQVTLSVQTGDGVRVRRTEVINIVPD
jgi:hypothetical protein